MLHKNKNEWDLRKTHMFNTNYMIQVSHIVGKKTLKNIKMYARS